MRVLAPGLIALVLVLSGAAAAAQPQAPSGPPADLREVVSVDLVTVAAEDLTPYLESLRLNWAALRRTAARDRHISGYEVLVAAPGADPSVRELILVTRYPTRAHYEAREQVFQPLIRARRQAALVEGRGPRDFVRTIRNLNTTVAPLAGPASITKP